MAKLLAMLKRSLSSSREHDVLEVVAESFENVGKVTHGMTPIIKARPTRPEPLDRCVDLRRQVVLGVGRDLRAQ